MAKRTRNPKREAIRRLVTLRNVLARELHRSGRMEDSNPWDTIFTSKLAIVIDPSNQAVFSGEYAEVAEELAHNLGQHLSEVTTSLKEQAGCE